MPGGFTWADFLAGYQAGGQAALDTAGVITSVIVALVVAGLAIGWALAAISKCADNVIEIARERAERRQNRGATVDTGDWGFDDIYSDSNRTHRRAS